MLDNTAGCKVTHYAKCKPFLSYLEIRSTQAHSGDRRLSSLSRDFGFPPQNGANFFNNMD